MPDSTPLRSNYDAEFADAIYVRWNAKWGHIYRDNPDALAYARDKADAHACAGDPEQVDGRELDADTLSNVDETVFTAFRDECKAPRGELWESADEDAWRKQERKRRKKEERKWREEKEWRERTGHTHNGREFRENCPTCWRERAEEQQRAAVAKAAREARERRKLHALAGWLIGSWVVATVIFCVWTTPLGINDAGGADFSFGNLFFAAWVGAFGYGLLFYGAFRNDDEPSKRKLFALAAVIPVACLIAGFALASKNEQFDRGFKSFAAYTGHFPRNALGKPYIERDGGSGVVTTCAKQVRTSDPHFCVETITQPHFAHRGEWVILGSYRFRERDQDPENPGPPLGAFDCSGDTGMCIES